MDQETIHCPRCGSTRINHKRESSQSETIYVKGEGYHELLFWITVAFCYGCKNMWTIGKGYFEEI
jgi:hypothetical protein